MESLAGSPPSPSRKRVYALVATTGGWVGACMSSTRPRAGMLEKRGRTRARALDPTGTLGRRTATASPSAACAWAAGPPRAPARVATCCCARGRSTTPAPARAPAGGRRAGPRSAGPCPVAGPGRSGGGCGARRAARPDAAAPSRGAAAAARRRQGRQGGANLRGEGHAAPKRAAVLPGDHAPVPRSKSTTCSPRPRSSTSSEWWMDSRDVRRGPPRHTALRKSLADAYGMDAHKSRNGIAQHGGRRELKSGRLARLKTAWGGSRRAS